MQNIPTVSSSRQQPPPPPQPAFRGNQSSMGGQRQQQGFMVVPERNAESQQQVVPHVPPGPPYTPASLGFRNEVLMQLSVSEFMTAGQLPQNTALIELSGLSSSFDP
jgi:hypothetical protein